jgi:lysozyme family protein
VNFETQYLRAFGITVSPKVEGEFSNDPEDRGNWTTGRVGEGELKGTKYGVSAAAYPQLDIANLNIHQVREIFWRDYWREAGCHLLPHRLALCIFDAAVNHGVHAASKILQEVLGFTGADKDGIVGLHTATAAKQWDQDDLIIDFQRARLEYMRALKGWPRNKNGWSRRVFRLTMEAAR